MVPGDAASLPAADATGILPASSEIANTLQRRERKKKKYGKNRYPRSWERRGRKEKPPGSANGMEGCVRRQVMEAEWDVGADWGWVVGRFCLFPPHFWDRGWGVSRL